MWVFVYFDLPTTTKKERKDYVLFRKLLLKDGFSMMQYSIYARHCPSRENAEVHTRRVKKWLPPQGEVIIFEITDAQFGRMQFFRGKHVKDRPDTPQQLELF
ncbi:CRISPR-associated endonuclease Cas2 [Persicobacter psychrovividus]|uniref:CRISPR-associated endoribonuclease Cas2 n=1 Tax=Persicobacter psychrovividus TaxID=387638 RepID=A0ABN6LLN7_9BACT|nr:CRISPR-associated endoribonuclease Cas2 [Persicobacter psychrovividus]